MPEFIRWSTPHITALVLTVLATAAIMWWGHRRTQQTRFLICRVLAVLIALEYVGEFTWRNIAHTYGSWENNLPLHFCSFMSIAAFIALWWRKHWACSLVFFAVLTASIQALITPAMASGYPTAAFFTFFISHGLLMVVALAIPVLIGWRARGYDDLKTLGLMNLYVLAIIPVNFWLGTNYGYTQGAPVPGTLLDYLGPAPWYYLWVELPVLAVFRIMMLFVHDKSEP